MNQNLDALVERAWVLLKSGNPSALPLAQEAERLARQQADEYNFAQSQFLLGVSALDAGRPEEALQELTNALTRFRWFNDAEREWYALVTIAQTWYVLDDYDQMHQTLMAAKQLEAPLPEAKFRWLDRIGMVR
ncbi:MAG: hypothetical protein SFU83_05005 [Meiothermus sp.]|nr:hypothetical protein [Meiothermus sp.]